MPIIIPADIKKVNIPLMQGFDIGTLVTNISYEDEADVNITKAKINRNKIWIQSKLWRSVPIKKAISNLKSSLRNLQTDYLNHLLVLCSLVLPFISIVISIPANIPTTNPQRVYIIMNNLIVTS